MKHLKYWFPPLIWAAFIFYASSKQGPDLPLFPGADKIIHLCVYGILGFFIARALFRAHNFDYVKLILITFFVAGLYGLSDEIHQMFVATRSAEALDLLMDFLGGLLGSIIYGYVPSNLKRC